MKYLETKIEEERKTDFPKYGVTKDGYTVQSGGPTSSLIRLAGEKRWRRLMYWQFSNAVTLFVRVKGEPYIVAGHQLPKEEENE